MAKDSMMLYIGLGVAGLVIFLTDNPIKDAIMKLVPAGGGAADDTASTDTTTKGKHKRGHRRGRHSHANYAEQDCGY
jgi:hypothetical protein